MTTRISPRELTPRSDADGTQFLRDDLTWAEPPTATPELPTGGAAGEVLKKASAADYDVAWAADAIGGGGGGGLPAGGSDGDILWYGETVTHDTITLRGTNSVTSGSSMVASVTVPLPAGTQVGDMMILSGATWSVAFSTPSGWTLVTSATVSSRTMATYSKVATQTDLDTGSVTLARASGTEATAAVVSAYTGVGAVHRYATPTSGASALTFPGLTTTVDGCRIVAVAASGYGSAAFSVSSPLTLRAQANGGMNSLHADTSQATAGATPALTGGAGGKTWVATTIALEPTTVTTVEAFWAPPRTRGAFTTANRPALTTADAGVTGFDTTLGKPVWWTGTGWVDSTGATV